jgi:hypothetical protein
MDLRTRLIAPLFRTLDDGQKAFDIDALVKRIILFETFIIDSNGLTEIPYLIRIFGFDGFLAILESGCVKFNCLVKATASLGPNLFLNEPPSNKVRLPFHFSFAEAGTGDLYYNLNLSFERIKPDIDISPRQFMRMRRAIYSSLENPQEDGNKLSLKNTRNDLVSDPNLLAKAVAMAVKNEFEIQVNYPDVKVDIQYETEYDFHATSNIQQLFDFDVPTAHKIIEAACLAIAKRNDRIEKMKGYSALSGFNDVDIPIFGDKLSFLASAISPSTDEDRFQRVIEISGLPQLKRSSDVQLNAKKLLEIQQSSEAIEFRQWLRTTDALSDAEINHQVHSLSKTIGRIVGGETGQSIRFLITNGIGFIPGVGQLISFPLSILDQFLIDKIFPRSGVTAFIDEMYPSIFEK